MVGIGLSSRLIGRLIMLSLFWYGIWWTDCGDSCIVRLESSKDYMASRLDRKVGLIGVSV